MAGAPMPFFNLPEEKSIPDNLFEVVKGAEHRAFKCDKEKICYSLGNICKRNSGRLKKYYPMNERNVA